jgi:DNA-binding MarR family transcriptional regulator
MSGPPNFELTLLLTLGSRVVIDELHSRLAALGYDDVRPAHGFVFQRIARGGATGGELAAFLDITKQAASTMVAELEQRGYVASQPHPTDRRGKIVTLTARGWDCLRASATVLGEIEARWAALIGAERLDALRADLRRLIAETNGGELPTRFRPVW